MMFSSLPSTARAIRCACAIRDTARELGVQIRAGLHTGEVECQGYRAGGACWGPGRCSRKASEVLVTSTGQMLVLGSGIGLADRGSHALKGVPDRWHLFAVEHT